MSVDMFCMVVFFYVCDDSSEESVLKIEANQLAIEHLVDNELKNAAAGLSLTSVN